ncbi:MAG: hypothetical protein ACAH83_20010 [Alphaproteobacteria bacterium]
MAQNETSSDRIKKFFAERGEGTENDWKRLSKKKNGDGEWVRQFENKQSGERLEVVEHADGRFSARPLTEAANSAFPKAAGAFLETDPEKNKAADQIIAADYEDVDRSLLKKAGRALANRYTFAVTDQMADEFDVSFYAIITPTKYWKDEGCCYDQPSPIDHLLPNGEDANDCGTWIFEKNYASAAALAKDLQNRGFTWDKDFQNFIDSKFTAGLSAAAAPQDAPKSLAAAPSHKP